MRTIKEGKRIKRLSKNKTNFRIFLLFCFSIIGLTVGYSALNEEIKITGEAFIRPIKDVRITDVRLSEKTNEGEFDYNNFNINSINVGASLPNTNSTVTYEVDISNIGNVPVIVKSITPEYGNNSDIEYVIYGIEVGKTVINTNANKTDDDMGKPTTIKVTIKYKDGVTTVPADSSVSLKLTFEFVEPVSILAKSPNDSSVFNNSNITRDKIETIKFRGTMDVPADVTADKVWDASLNKDSSVIAYYTVNNGTGLYNVVIGGYGKIQFPPGSSYLFRNYKNLKTINFGDYIDTSKVTIMYEMFSGCSNLTNLDVSNFNTSNVTRMYSMFSGCSNLTSLDVSKFDTSKVTDMELMFYNCSSLTSLDVSNFNTSNVIKMYSMFSRCSNLTNLNLSNFDTSKVTSMIQMFYNCSNLTSLDVSNFNTSKVTKMYSMFDGCSNLTSLDVSNFNTSNVTKMYSMFSDCSSLTSLDVSKFDTSKVTDMSGMFYGCSSLTSLDVSKFDTSNVINMIDMFYGCSSLTSLNIKNFTFDKVTSSDGMLYKVPSSVIIYVKDQTAYDFINGKRDGGCTTNTCPICSNTGITCP